MMGITAETRFSVVLAMSKEELDEKCNAVIEAGKIKRVINTYTAKTSKSMTKLTYIAEVEDV